MSKQKFYRNIQEYNAIVFTTSVCKAKHLKALNAFKMFFKRVINIVIIFKSENYYSASHSFVCFILCKKTET